MTAVARRWSEGEDDVLRSLWPVHGPGWEGWDEGAIPGRTMRACKQRACRLGLIYATGNWSDAERQVIRDNYPAHGPEWDGWDVILPGRTHHAIQMCASRMGVSVRPEIPRGRGIPWTVGELRALKQHYPMHGSAWDGWSYELPRRSRCSISSMAKALGIHRQTQREKVEDASREIIAEARRLVSQGASSEEVVRRTARVAGVKPETMRRLLPELLRNELRRRGEP